MHRPGTPVVLDAMGGDHGPAELVAGAVAAVRQHGARIILAGHAEPLLDLVDRAGAATEIEVVHASGRSAAMVSAGSTGGTVATAVARLGCSPGVSRPAIAVLLPATPHPVVLLEAGATADPAPEMLAQFGVLGAAYAAVVLGIESPTVGLLTIGSEPGKGNRLARRAQPLLAAADAPAATIAVP